MFASDVDKQGPSSHGCLHWSIKHAFEAFLLLLSSSDDSIMDGDGNLSNRVGVERLVCLFV
jgi:hypothetical protein